MAVNFVYPHAIDQLARALLNLGTADLRVLLAMDLTTAFDDDANRDVTTIAGFVTLDEHGSAGRRTLASVVLAKDAASNETRLTADPSTWSPLPLDGGQDVKGAILYVHVTDDTDSYPLGGILDGGYPVTPTGSIPHVINWDAILGALAIRSGV